MSEINRELAMRTVNPLRKFPFAGNHELNSCYYNAGKSCPVEALIQCEQTVSLFRRVRANDKIGENAAGTGVSLFLTSCGIFLKRTPGCPPDFFSQVPFNTDSCFCKKRI